MIKPKTAHIKIECPIDDFYQEWEQKEDSEPTQKDYDAWAYSKTRSFLDSNRYIIFNSIRLE
jgi:hypothetical protein